MKNILDLTSKLISIPSESGNGKAMDEVLEICAKYLKDYPFKEFRKDGCRSRLYYNTKYLPEKFRLIMNAHLDVVPGKPEQYKSFIKAGILFGRGASDMKAAAAVFVILFSRIARDLPFPLGLSLVTDEEMGGFKGTGFQSEKGIKTDFIIAGEPTDMLINNQAKGVLWVEFLIKGRASHAAYLWEGQNAIVRATRLIGFLLKKFPIPKEEKWKTTCNVAKIEVDNNAVNKVPENCRVIVDIRYIPSDLKRVKDIISKFKNSHTSFKYIEEGNASFSNKSNKDIKLLKKTLQKFGESGKFVKKNGSSDVRFYNKIGTEGVCLGPIGGGLHSNKEWVSLEGLFRYYKVIEDLLSNIT